MAGDKEAFLSRWSRVKLEAEALAGEGGAGKTPLLPSNPPRESEATRAPERLLPPVEGLNFESDFTAFMQSKTVEEGVKRAALKKLFADPRFNVMDGLDTYIDDYSIEDPISPELLGRLQHVKRTLFGPEPEKSAAADAAGEPAAGEPAPPNTDTLSAEVAKDHVDRG